MSTPDLNALRTGDADEWDLVFQELWPVVFAVAQLKLKPYLPGEIEDVAIEALEELVEKVATVETGDELRPLAASIAHHRAVSLLRRQFARKRGAGQTDSLDAQIEDGHGSTPPIGTADSPIERLEQKELAEKLGNTLTELKPPLGDVLSDFFLHGLRYEEIAANRAMAVGSVGVYLKRGLDAMRRIWSGRDLKETTRELR